MRGNATVPVCAVLLSACASWEPGQDQLGQELLPPANTVLAAVNRYVQANHRAPPDLAALVPRYLAALPPRPELDYSARRSSLVFNYSSGRPGARVDACQAHIGDSAFHCVAWH